VCISTGLLAAEHAELYMPGHVCLIDYVLYLGDDKQAA